MLVGAAALLAYSQLTRWLLMRPKWHALPAALCALLLWFGVAFGLWAALWS